MTDTIPPSNRLTGLVRVRLGQLGRRYVAQIEDETGEPLLPMMSRLSYENLLGAAVTAARDLGDMVEVIDRKEED